MFKTLTAVINDGCKLKNLCTENSIFRCNSCIENISNCKKKRKFNYNSIPSISEQKDFFEM